ncbi:hypothetical protein HAX54_031305 [Datura stramonium]|uniref:Uncharacterized protein n=1 Tax=Datura stramonium TaxID=4076 RepID=A0ABS8V905_DATST|nr:hypothetical protein [Datura stramonium]
MRREKKKAVASRGLGFGYAVGEEKERERGEWRLGRCGGVLWAFGASAGGVGVREKKVKGLVISVGWEE